MSLFSFKIFYTFLKRNPLYSFITVSGFAVSLMFVMLLSLYVRQELSIDDFHVNKNRIYRLTRDNGAFFGPPIGELLKGQFPQIESYTRTYQNSWNAVFQDRKQEKIKTMLVDSSFFSIFSFDLIIGDPLQVLRTKNSAVLSYSYSRKIFGNDNPIGKTFTIDSINFIISGIFKDIPQNTHFEQCDAIINFIILADLWGWKELLTTNENSSFGLYFLAKSGTDLPAKESEILEQFKKNYWIFSSGFSKSIQFEALKDVYFSKEYSPAIKQNSLTAMIIYSAISLLILIISIINYVNLTVAQIGFRIREVVIKRLLGSSKKTLLFQHIIESILLSFGAALIGICLAFWAEPFFNSQYGINLNLIKQFDFSLILIIICVISIVGIISGLFPALVISKLNLIDVIKGTITRKTKSTYSKILITFQYTVTYILIFCTWVVCLQSSFLVNYYPGFNKSDLFWMENTITANQKAVFRDMLKSIPGVIDVSYCRGTPIDGGNNMSFTIDGKPISFQEFKVDSVYFSLNGIDVTETSAAFSKQGIWLNTTAINMLNLNMNPPFFRIFDYDVPVLGIVSDFNFRPLYQKIGPIIIKQLNEKDTPWSILVKIDNKNPLETIDKIRERQASFTSGKPMESGFVSESMAKWYLKEKRLSQIISSFTLLSIIFSTMGIFGMALYYVQQKEKEIGIRKIFGANILEIIVKLNLNFIHWIIVAFVIACPISIIILKKWLQNFAYRINLPWWVFVSTGIIVLGITLLTISLQSWKTSSKNPIESLRYE
ncbi:MAG: FtsX-like permease family protein [Sedimentibacter sp.]|uniref:ABC transporter permease n=1 Tax=Sedimentibacter sp. TaxID=1960295 RepID=UPI00298236C6|nr:FtsX-like permease family protein [Sedimentibacter sp.]MDW5298896.1 FtsX-like permease family protein [Sedimentibacter sp.]